MGGFSGFRLRAGFNILKVDKPRAEWQFVTPGLHPGYIDWDRFESNQRRLADNARAFGGERRSGPAREGPALLQGRVLCGLCGERMGVHYSLEHGRTVPVYVCQETVVRRGGKVCRSRSPARLSIQRSAPCWSS